ncbi:hypothetical protein ACN93_20475 [Gordonia paraffinivorans]|nr:hypothetical protein ACN93_20475 [Gordonia paraffinivorans]
MGTVYLARHPRLSRNQALKVLDSALGTDPSFRDRFRREAQLAARLDHPNIVAVHDAGVDDGVMWIAMQYIEGTDAAELLRTAPAPLPADQAVDIIAQAGAGLDHAHAFGMLHRDVKPANILVAENIGPRGRPRVLVADFGVARLLDDSGGLTETGMVVGTLAYAAPEMFAAAELTPAVDIYALGCVLYELLTGEQVFTGRDALALVNAHGTTPPPRVTALRPDLPPAIDDVVFRALAKDPAQRFTSCADLADAALAALSDAGRATLVPDHPNAPGTPAVDLRKHPSPPPTDHRPAPETLLSDARSRTPLPSAADQGAPETLLARARDRTPPPSAHRTPRAQPLPAALAHWQHPNAAPPPTPYPAVHGEPPAHAAPPAHTGPARPEPPRRRNPLPYILAGCAVLLVVAIIAVGAVYLIGTGDDDRAGPATSTPRVAQPTPGDGRPAPVPQPTTVNPPAGAPLTGTWRGAVTGDDSGFDVVVTFAGSNPVRATVEYPQIPCAGTWSEESRRGDTISLVERVTSGPCVTSQITLDRRPDGTLGFRSDYFAESRGRTLTIYATQRRA